MPLSKLLERLESCPIIPAIRDDKWAQALDSPAEVLFYLEAHLLTIQGRVQQAHDAGKSVFIHVDLAEGIGKDREGIQFLADCGVDGIISTRPQMIRMAKDTGLLTVQRFFALDSRGLDSVQEMLKTTNPHMMEIMPGVIPKVLEKFTGGHIPVIAGGLLEQKAEITAALSSKTVAVSTGKENLWYL